MKNMLLALVILPILLALACSSGSLASKDGSVNPGHAGAGGGAGGSSALDCSTVGCGATPMCGQTCSLPCGCCSCGEGQHEGALVCHGGCLAPATDDASADQHADSSLDAKKEGAGGSGGADGSTIDCSAVGCTAPPLCGQACSSPCGCCACSEGGREGDRICRGGCWALADAGTSG